MGRGQKGCCIKVDERYLGKRAPEVYGQNWLAHSWPNPWVTQPATGGGDIARDSICTRFVMVQQCDTRFVLRESAGSRGTNTLRGAGQCHNAARELGI